VARYYNNDPFITVQVGQYSLTGVLGEVTASEQDSGNDLRVYVRNLFQNGRTKSQWCHHLLYRV
jgi:hypothetical protein